MTRTSRAALVTSILFALGAGAGAPLSAAPAGVQYTSFGLPMYPTPKIYITHSPPEANGDGGISESVKMDPHVPLATVLAWYKAHMPAGSFQPGPNPAHAGFEIRGDKVIRYVVLDQIKGHVQTDILLIKRTSK